MMVRVMVMLTTKETTMQMVTKMRSVKAMVKQSWTDSMKVMPMKTGSKMPKEKAKRTD